MSAPDFQPFDLLGDPVHPNKDGRGKPAHFPTDEKRKIVKALWAQGRNNEYCAAALGISLPTFNKHYFKTKRQKAHRANARAAVEALHLQAVLKGVAEGNMAAVKLHREMLHRADLERLSQDIAHDRRKDEADEPKARPRGKKEQRVEDARELDGLYAPGDPPRSLVN